MSGFVQSGRFGGGATPTFVGAATTEVSAGTGNFTVTPHASTAAGNLLVLTVFADGSSGTVDTLAGWTAVGPHIGTVDAYVFYRTHTSGTYTFTRSVSTPTLMTMCATFSTAAYDTENTTFNTFSAQPQCASVTPSATALILVGWGTNANDNLSTPPSGFTDIPDVGSGSMAIEHSYSAATYPAGMPTGTLIAATNFSTLRAWRSVTIAVKGA